MIRAIVHQGFLDETIEYFATVAGPDLDKKFFFEQINDSRGKLVRYFGGASEISLQPDGVTFSGNGGTVGEYMFGGHFPVQDLLNESVVNRLVLFGAVYDREVRELRFTPKTSGFESYESLFFHGNAVANYFFFIDDRRRFTSVTERQEQTLKSIGKLLKRSRRVGGGNFLALTHELYEALGDPNATIFLIRIIHRDHQRFHELCRDHYAGTKALPQVTSLIDIEPRILKIDPYQLERIQIDVIYHHPDNHGLIDEYKRVLAACTGAHIGPSERARLMRLRTLSLRNEVPLSIFDTLEEIVLQEGKMTSSEEAEYIQATRAILEGFMFGKSINKRLSAGDLVELIENKQKAVENRDQTFEEILLDTGRLIDERALAEEDYERMESFGELITLFDRFDHTMTVLNKLAFMDDVELTNEQVRSLLGNMHVFEELGQGLFQRLFIDSIVSNDYALGYGRKKLFALVNGLASINYNVASIADVTNHIRSINLQERAYFTLYKLARRRMSTFYLELNTTEGRETFRREIADELPRETELHELHEVITEELLDEVITKIRLEAFYINQLLPRIIDDEDLGLRNDFLANSGLDRFQIEDLEREYFEMRAFPPHLLEAIQRKSA